ncbi:23S rRNA m(2)A-2503 methyltransferase [Anaerobacterium chartisolvens]|uniref:Probable dual-specificity RNA methyltransferase RlmN n=1 Tax=Anaerobacterium chartisolvens TaxID=1297424 RepID=A0A369B5L9_9FIRM|nr:23S rRNA (adenine(2503)-C(2))-methyltransferase RlmN [Anaerobacterium chartisolvens]RCX16783.1 23S rRNA m(2)A-2503 methyltransferase [Anaerobacterium chartisolvens]
MDDKINLLDLNIPQLEELLRDMGQEKFRARQVFQWLAKGIPSIDDMTNLSKALREKLSERAFIGRLDIRHKLVSKIDGTKKYLFGLPDGNIIESVLMEYKHGFTVCISSQVGCRMGCGFCASTGAGFERNLTPGEMLGQVLSIQHGESKRISNIVVMGIGEPLDNYKNLIAFLKLVNHPDGLNIGYRHISVSTCGLVPEILSLSQESLPITLSISLHASNDEMRSKIMPVNKKYSIDKLIEACKIYTEVTRRRITFEYALIRGVNDSRKGAYELAKRIRGLLCHVNIIPVNTVAGIDMEKSSRPQIEQFKSILERNGIEATIRREMGSDINAACGQLRRSQTAGLAR